MGLTFLSVPSPGFKEIERHPSKKVKQHILVRLWSALVSFFRQLVLQILAAGPLPRHVAIIMDGNRRYAERQHIERHIGHLYGYDRLIDTLEVFMELGVQVLTVYAFSIDNFKRPEEEVSSLMQLLHNKLVSLGEDQSLVKAYGIKVCILGDLSLLPEAVRGAAKRTMDVTRENKGPVFNLCISYTAREEMTSAVEKARDLILTEAELADERTEKHLRGSGLADGHELYGQQGWSTRGVSSGNAEPKHESKGDATGLVDAPRLGQVGPSETGEDDAETHHDKDLNWERPSRSKNETRFVKKHECAEEGPEGVCRCSNGHVRGLLRDKDASADMRGRPMDGDLRGWQGQGQGRGQKQGQKQGQGLFSRTGCCCTMPRHDGEDDACVGSLREAHRGGRGVRKRGSTVSDGPSRQSIASYGDTFQIIAPMKAGLGAKSNGFHSSCCSTTPSASLEGACSERRSPRAAAVGGGEGIIERHLYTAGCPPVDLLIRTSGETRLSNFMLWQSSDALLSFYSVLWPDFSFRHMMWAILDYQRAWPHLQRFQSSSSSASCNMLNSNVDPS